MRDFAAISRSEDAYVVIHGRVSAMGGGSEQDDVVSFPMRIEGQRLTRAGFASVAREEFTWIAECGAALSCPVSAPEGEALLFLWQSPTGLLLVDRPCGGTAHFGVTGAGLDAVAACHRAGACD